jgi:uncharacterized repeat protein (TIGR01451 family)
MRTSLGATAALAVVSLVALVLAAPGGAAPAGSTDLAITKADSPDPVLVGGSLTYSIGVENRGPAAASGVNVTDTLPKGVDFVSATSSAGTCARQNRKVTCALGSIPFGGNYGAAPSVTIVVIPRTVGTITNKATVKGKEKDPGAPNNSASATTTVLAAPTCRGVPATVTGTPEGDVLGGTAGPDVIVGLAGNDTIRAGMGRDLICSGAGADIVASGAAADRLFGAAGGDRLLGGGGPDVIKAGSGGDLLRGGRGGDRLRGGAGFDRCLGGAGRDSTRGCEGDHTAKASVIRDRFRNVCQWKTRELPGVGNRSIRAINQRWVQMAEQTKRKSQRKKSGGSKQKRTESGRRSGKTPGQRSDGSGRNKSPTAKKESQGSDKGSNGGSARNQGGDRTVPERMYEDYTLIDPGEISDTDEPDVVVDIPVVKVDELHFELDDLEARVALHAKVLDLVELNVGVMAKLGKVELDIKGVEAQALLRARLDHVTAIIDRVLTTLDRNPDLLKSIGKSLQSVGEGAGKGVGQIGEGAGSAVEDVGEGASGAVEDVGEGAGKGVGEIGQGAGGAVEDVGEGAGEAAGEIGEGAGKAAGELGEGAGDAVGGLGQGAGQLAGAAGGAGGQGGNGNGGDGGLTAGKLAKEAAKLIAKELTSVATDEAKELGMAASHKAADKAAELGERRRQRRASKHNATEAAMSKASKSGVDLDEIEGSGAEGRITVRDVEAATTS